MKSLEEIEKEKLTQQSQNAEQLQRGASLLAQNNALQSMAQNAVASLEKISDSKSGIEGVSKPKLTSEEREQRQKQQSIDRRLIRETKKAASTGRASNWLKRYSAQKESEFNSENASFQNLQKQQSSITVSYGSAASLSSQPNSANITSSQNVYTGVNLSTLSTSSEFFDL